MISKEDCLKIVCNLRGYIVVWEDQDITPRIHRVGEVVTRIGGERFDLGQPLRVVAETNHQDIEEQLNLLFRLEPKHWPSGNVQSHILRELEGRKFIRYWRLVTD